MAFVLASCFVLGLVFALATGAALTALGFAAAGLAIGWLAGLTNTAIAPALLAALLGTTAVAQAVVPAAAYFGGGDQHLASITAVACACALGFTAARCSGVAKLRLER